MNINLKNMSNIELTKLLDLVALANDQYLAKKVVYQLACRYHRSFKAQLQDLDKRAIKRENYPSHSMVTKLWK